MRGTVPVATENKSEQQVLACCWEDAMDAQPAVPVASGGTGAVKESNEKLGKMPGWSEAGSDKASRREMGLANRRAQCLSAEEKAGPRVRTGHFCIGLSGSTKA